MQKISVIIPVYNTEQYLKRAIDSLINSTFIHYLEIIVVNDNSPGDCKSIVESYDLGNLKYIKHAFNKGLFQARYTGILHATSEYIVHLDADDWIEPTIYEKLYNYTKKNSLDLVLFNMVNKNINLESTFKENEIIYPFNNKCGQNLIDEILLCNTNRWTLHACWNKIIKTNVAKQSLQYLSHIKHLNLAEDLLWSISFFLILKDKHTISAIEDIGLNYYLHSNAITKKCSVKTFKKNLDDTIVVYNELHHLFNTFKIDNKYHKYLNRTNIYVIKYLFNKYPDSYKLLRINIFIKFHLLLNQEKLESFLFQEAKRIICEKILTLKIKDVYIYGIDKLALSIKKELDNHNILIHAFILSNIKNQTTINDIPIIEVNNLQQINNANIVIASVGSFHIIEQTIKRHTKNISHIIGVFSNNE